MTGTLWHDEELLRALHLKLGWSMRKIARKFDADPWAVRDWMERRDIPRRNRIEATIDARRREWVSHRLEAPVYGVWADRIADEEVSVHQLLAIADGADPHEVFAEDTNCHHRSGHPLDNRPGNIEVLGHSEHSSYHRQQEIPECKHQIIQSANIGDEGRA